MCRLILLAVGAAPLSFDAALAQVDATPELTGAWRAAEVRRLGLDTLSRLTANPLVVLQPGMRSDPASIGPEGQLTVSQAFNLGGLARARRDVATSEAAQARLERQLLRRERRVAVGRAWLSAWASHAAAAAAHAERAQSQELVLRLERAVASGGATRVELATARAFAAEAQALALDWEGREAEARAELGRLLGARELPHVDGPLPALDDVAEDVAPQRAARLQARRLELEAQGEAQRSVEVQAQWATQLNLSLQGGHERPGQWYGNVGVGVTLPAFERGQRERSAHQANSERLAGQQAQAEAEADVEWAATLHELEHTRRAYEVVSGVQLPAALEAAELEQQLYARGEATLLELTLLRRQALAARIAALVAEANRVAARARARELLDAQEGAP